MKRTLTLFLCFLPCTVHAQITPPHMVRTPDIHGDRVVFSTEGDLWLASLSAGTAQRITTHEAAEAGPRFSPDGKWIAFTGGYDGGTDVYLMPVEGGAPKRITFDPSGAEMVAWTPDGAKIVFRSRRSNPQALRLYAVSRYGGVPEALPMEKAAQASFAADGKRMAFTRLSLDNHNWKRYRGGMANRVWLADLEKKTFRKIGDDTINEQHPLWIGEAVYYVSEKDGTANLWRYDVKSGMTRRVTAHDDYDIKSPATDGKRIIYQWGNALRVYDIAAGKERPVKLALTSDRIHARAHSVDGAPGAFALGPTGKRIVAEARGQLFTIPAEKGEVRPVAPLLGTRSRQAAWSPDGKWIAFISDRSGEDNVWIAPASGTGEPRAITDVSKLRLEAPVWSPDSKRILYRDNSLAVWLVDVESRLKTEVVRGAYGGIDDYRFSPDGKWVAYSFPENRHLRSLYLYNVADKKATRLTFPPTRDRNPVFDPAGKYLYFLSERNVTATGDAFDFQNNFDKATRIYLISLGADTPSPLPVESDEEPEGGSGQAIVGSGQAIVGSGQAIVGSGQAIVGSGQAIVGSGQAIVGSGQAIVGSGQAIVGSGQAAVGSGQAAVGSGQAAVGSGQAAVGSGQAAVGSGQAAVGSGQAAVGSGQAAVGSGQAAVGSGPGPKPNDPATQRPTKVDLEGFSERIMEVPVAAGRYSGLDAIPGKVLFVSREDGPPKLKAYDFAGKKEIEIAAGIQSYDISHDRKKIAIRTAAGIQIADAGNPVAPGAGRVDTSGWRVQVEPEREWRQVFLEAWRNHRDTFYDAGMHGRDWDAVRKRYEALLPSVAARSELNEIIGEMQGELNVSHEFVGGGYSRRNAPPDPGIGSLGAEVVYDVSAKAHRITRIFRGDGFDASARSPLLMPGVGVKEGDYLLAVNTVPLKADEDPTALLAGLGGKTITLLVNSKPTTQGAKTIRIKAMGNDRQARYYDWVARQRAYAQKNGGANLAYIHLPDMGGTGIAEFTKHFYANLDKDGIVIDVRYNRGGIVSGQILERLRRVVFEVDQPRYGQPMPYPYTAYLGRVVVLCNEGTSSDGEYFCTGLRAMKIGPTVGTRTWGGYMAVGGMGTIDGGFVSTPFLGSFTPEGEWLPDGYGFTPDHIVEEDPNAFVAGRDPQMDKALELLKEEIRKNPPAWPKRKDPPSRDKAFAPNRK